MHCRATPRRISPMGPNETRVYRGSGGFQMMATRIGDGSVIATELSNPAAVGPRPKAQPTADDHLNDGSTPGAQALIEHN